MNTTAGFPPLPIDAVLPQLIETLAQRNAAVLVAEPGAGKTTRVPLALLGSGWRDQGKILLLVPRRVAARAAAAQMSRLIGEKVGETVGYRVRMESQVSAKTKIEILTEGIFARMILDDPFLAGVRVVIFDEFHERNLGADLGLALALDVQAGLRRDLRLLVMSATLDAARVSALMDEAPVISSKGRSFPVETRYAPSASQDTLEQAATKAVLKALREETGSILVFLPGAREIERTAENLRESAGRDAIIAPLYSALDLAEQDRAITPAPQGRRKVVLASAIAETSLTIEGIRVVIDSGFARVPRYNPGSGLTRLETVRVSQASAEQRRGRAGRLEPGICYRLWGEGQTRALPVFNTPEILEADLSPLLLTCAAFGVTAPETLKFLDLPPAPALKEARALLRQLEALDDEGRITQAGQAMAMIPLPPRLAHMLAVAAREGAGMLAAQLAVLLTERGLGGTSSDITHRLQQMKNDKSPRARQAQSMAENWLKTVDAKSQNQQSALSAGDILAFAFPDRIALARTGKPGDFLLANGKGAFIDPADPLAREACLIVAEVQGNETRARILLAARLDRASLEQRFAHLIENDTRLYFDAKAMRVRGRHVKRLGALALDERPLAVSGDEASAVLLQGLKALGANAFEWPEAAEQFLARIAFLRAHAPDEWPDLRKERLMNTLEDWLAPYIPGVTALADIHPETLHAALEGLLSRAQKAALQKQAPASFTAPAGQAFRIDYSQDEVPRVALRAQQLFGMKEQPMLANGKVALAFELLSPAGRPIQLTRNLPAFWQGSWADVRRDMRGRYPKHDWPEDPANAKPTAGAKPRK